MKPIVSASDYRCAHKPFKDLFYHLYSDTLQKSVLLNNALHTNIGDHYTKWKEINVFAVCPFCGVENYTSAEGTNRDPYDHWLCKSKYPLSAINFKNLVPIGDKCNQTAVKGEKDILHKKATRKRRASFYPYFSHSGITISLTCIVPPSAGFKGEWEINVSPVDKKDLEKVETWLEVFNLKERYLSWVKGSLELWKEEFLRYIEKNTITLTSDIIQVKTTIKNWKNSLLSIKVFSGVLLLEAYIEYLLNNTDDAFIFAFANVTLKNS
ncbi:MAG: hypothetical protein ABI166_13795 [Mucilaginibacter sp.]